MPLDITVKKHSSDFYPQDDGESQLYSIEIASPYVYGRRYIGSCWTYLWLTGGD